MPGKHQRTQIDRYFDIHFTAMARYRREGFVVDDSTLEISGLGSKIISIKGIIACHGGVAVDVKKFLNVTKHDGESFVETFEFKYAAHVAGLCPIFRYCSPHGHRPYTHFHTYDVFGTGEEDLAAKERPLTEDEWPTLGQAIEQLWAWYRANGHRLDELRKYRR